MIMLRMKKRMIESDKVSSKEEKWHDCVFISAEEREGTFIIRFAVSLVAPKNAFHRRMGAVLSSPYS